MLNQDQLWEVFAVEIGIERHQSFGLHERMRADEKISQDATRTDSRGLPPPGRIFRLAPRRVNPGLLLYFAIKDDAGSIEEPLNSGFSHAGVREDLRKNER